MKGNKKKKRRGEVKTCKICGEEFYVRPSRTHYKYCSIECRNADKEYWVEIGEALGVRPTSLEKAMIGLIKKHNLPYKYTGDGDFGIGGKNPDFIHIDGEKKLIEVGNEYHHQGDYEKERREHFAEYGWESFIFIGDELDKKRILEELNFDK